MLKFSTFQIFEIFQKFKSSLNFFKFGWDFKISCLNFLHQQNSPMSYPKNVFLDEKDLLNDL